MYTLDGRQKEKALHAALRKPFPRPAALERLVEFHLDEHLAVIAGEGALDDIIFRLIAWAEAQGRLDALVNGARAEAPGNPQLIEFERTVVEAQRSAARGPCGHYTGGEYPSTMKALPTEFASRTFSASW